MLSLWLWMQDRSQFTQSLVAQLNSHDPSFNYVVCHTGHEVKWDGTHGVDWSHSHQEFDIQVGGTIGFVLMQPSYKCQVLTNST